MKKVQIVGYINTNKDHLHGQNEIRSLNVCSVDCLAYNAKCNPPNKSSDMFEMTETAVCRSSTDG